MKFIVKHLSLTMNRAGVPIHVYQAPFALGGPGTRFKDPGMEYSFWNMVWHMVQQGKTYQFGGTNPMVAGDVLARAVLNNALSPAPRPISYPVTPVTNEQLAERLGLDLVPYKEFRRGLVRANRFRLREVKWRDPISSARREWQRASFVRSLFPRCLPTLLTDIDKAVQAPAVPLNAGIPAIDVLEANARNIRKIAKDLPARAADEQAAAPKAAASQAAGDTTRDTTDGVRDEYTRDRRVRSGHRPVHPGHRGGQGRHRRRHRQGVRDVGVLHRRRARGGARAGQPHVRDHEGLLHQPRGGQGPQPQPGFRRVGPAAGRRTVRGVRRARHR
jgi:hypothetical protein